MENFEQLNDIIICEYLKYYSYHNVGGREYKNLYKDIDFETILTILVREHSLNYSNDNWDEKQ